MAVSVFNPTEVRVFKDQQGNPSIIVEIENSPSQFAWRLKVGSKQTCITSDYSGLLELDGWIVSAAYWSGLLPEMVPFRIVEAVRV